MVAPHGRPAAGPSVALLAVALVWRYGAANLSRRDRVVAPLPDNSVTQAANPAEPANGRR